jgi:hypothetical protein
MNEIIDSMMQDSDYWTNRTKIMLANREKHKKRLNHFQKLYDQGKISLDNFISELNKIDDDKIE